MLERLFKLSANKTTVGTELLAGMTTFLTMACIIFVNPEILGVAKMPFESVFVATCVASAIGSFLMAFLANLPAGAGSRHGAERLLRLRRGRRHGP